MTPVKKTPELIINERINELYKIKREANVALSNIDESHFLFKRAKNRLVVIDERINENVTLLKFLQGGLQ